MDTPQDCDPALRSFAERAAFFGGIGGKASELKITADVCDARASALKGNDNEDRARHPDVVALEEAAARRRTRPDRVRKAPRARVQRDFSWVTPDMDTDAICDALLAESSGSSCGSGTESDSDVLKSFDDLMSDRLCFDLRFLKFKRYSFTMSALLPFDVPQLWSQCRAQRGPMPPRPGLSGASSREQTMQASLQHQAQCFRVVDNPGSIGDSVILAGLHGDFGHADSGPIGDSGVPGGACARKQFRQ